MKRLEYILLAAFVLVLTSLACNAVLPQSQPTSVPTLVPTATLVPSQIPEAVSTQPPATSTNLPQTDADVPRAHPSQVKLALDRGDAIIVDVRGPAAYAERHITGALEISLATIEADPTSLNLDKNKWIITYCT
jgi:hypothetical protein